MAKRSLFLGTLILTIFVLSFSVLPAIAQDAEPTAIVGEAGTGGTQIVFWNGLTGSDGLTLLKMTEQFVKENPDISVHTEMMAWNVYWQKLQASLVAGNPPDIFLLHTLEMPTFAQMGVLLPTDSWFDYGGGTLPSADYSQPLFDATLWNGTRYGIELDNHGWGLWVNPDLFAAAGLDPNVPPTNNDEFVAMATKLTIDANGKHPDEEGFDPNNVAQWGFEIEWIRWMFPTMLYQFGGSLFDPATSTATINNEAGHKALQMMVDWIYKYHIAAPEAAVAGWDSYVAGKIAMIANGTWFRNFVVEVNPGTPWQVWQVPQWGEQLKVAEESHVMYLPASLTGEKLAAAQRFMTWISDHGVDWAASGMVPARQSQVAQLDEATYPSNLTIGESIVEFGQPPAQSTAALEIQDAWEAEISAALNGQKSVDDALNAAAEQIQAALDSAG